MKRAIIYLWTWYADVLVWLLILLCRAVSGTRLHWYAGTLWCEFKRDGVIDRWTHFHGVTLGHGGLILEGMLGTPDKLDQKIEFHEDQHVKQYEVNQLFTTLLVGAGIALGGSWWLLVALPFGGYLTYACGLLCAVLRGEDWYRGNTFEAAAFALADQWEEQQGKGV